MKMLQHAQMALAVMVVLASCAGCAAAAPENRSLRTASAPNAAEQSLFEKLRRYPRPQFGAANWDILDYPQKPQGPLNLQNALKPGESVAVLQAFKGRIVVLAEIDPSRKVQGETVISANPWSAREGVPPAVQAYKRLFGEYAQKGVAFVAVWRDTGSKGDDGAKAAAYAARYGLPGLVLLDAKGKGSRSKGAYYEFSGAAVPGHNGGGMLVCVLDRQGRLVYRGFEAVGFGYHTARLILDRLLDPKFDMAVRREFCPEKSRLLPVVRKRPNGLAYIEDFESYPDDHAFKLEPRWGFTYEKQSRLDQRPVIAVGEGRNGSKAALVNRKATGSCFTTYGLQHRFPAPLRDGYVRFFIRRRPAAIAEPPVTDATARFLRPRRSLCVRFGRPGGHEPTGLLFATGDWMKESFVLGFRADRPSPVRMAKDAWQEVSVTCRPGRKAEVKVDGRPVGFLDAEAVDWIGFRQADPGKDFYVDDVELFYRGEAEKTLAEHEAPQPRSLPPVEPFTEAEQRALRRRYLPQMVGRRRAQLPPNAIPRADVVGWKPPYITFDHPVEVGPFPMDSFRRPGETVDITEKYRGRIVWLTKASPMSEFYIRNRTAHRSPTVFNRTYRLAKEYAPKGIVVVGLTAADGGHRGAATSYDDRLVTASEAPLLARALMAELKGLRPEHVIYGFFPDIYADILAERIPNRSRIWKKTMRGRLLDGQFGGPGVDIILNREGKAVFRGAGPDGQGYWQQRTVFDRLLDADFDAAYRQEFRNPALPYYRSPLLPLTEERPDGLAYRDDFESYTDTYDFGLQPRWGFSYTNIPTANTPALCPGEGRDGSQAILVNKLYRADVWCGNDRGHVLSCRHEFPVALRDGHFSFYIRRGPHVKYHGEPPLFRIAITCLDAEEKPTRTLIAAGPWTKETFRTVPTAAFMKWDCRHLDVFSPADVADSGVGMAKNEWQEVKLICKPGSKARMTVDGRDVAELETEAVSAVELRGEVWSGTYVDDAELFYRGDAATLKAGHEQALKQDLARRQAAWKKEADDWEAALARRHR